MIKRRRPDRPDHQPSEEDPSTERPPAGSASERDPESPSSENAAALPTVGSGTDDSAPEETPPSNPAEVPAPGGDEPPTGDDGGGTGTPPAREPKRRGGFAAVLALLLALAAAGAAGWLGWRLLQLEEQVAAIPEQQQSDRESALQAVNAVEQRVEGVADDLRGRIEQQGARLEEQIASIKQQVSQLRGQRGDVVERLQQRLQAAETAIHTLRNQRERNSLDWLMAEVRYLVSMAANRLRITGDVQGAIAALQAADSALARMGDPRALDLRERIVEDINALQAVEPADVAGIALRIQNLATRIPELVRASGARPDQSGSATGNDAGPPSGGGAGNTGWWASVRRQLSQLVTVRREPEPAPPKPDRPAPAPVPSAELPPGERLLLALKDASRAALNHEPQAYDKALGQALDILDQAYARDAPANQRFRQALEALRGQRVTTELPSLAPTVEQTQALASRLDGSARGQRQQDSGQSQGGN